MEDAGEYSCEMTEEEEDKIREFVTVAVFERQSEEDMSEGKMIQEEEEEIEEINFFGPVDVENSKYKNIEDVKKHQTMPDVAVINSVSNSHIELAHMYILPLVTCGLCVLL